MVAEPHPQSIPGSERIGPYRVIQRLGAGGMGEVVLAHDDRIDRLVAIKRLHDVHAATPERRERFHREARIQLACSPGKCDAMLTHEPSPGGGMYGSSC